MYLVFHFVAVASHPTYSSLSSVAFHARTRAAMPLPWSSLTRAVQYLSDMSATPANKSAATPLPLRNAFIINPPDGPYPYSGLQVFGYVVIGFFTALSLVVCGLRVYSRRLIKGLYVGKFIARPKTSR